VPNSEGRKKGRGWGSILKPKEKIRGELRKKFGTSKDEGKGKGGDKTKLKTFLGDTTRKIKMRTTLGKRKKKKKTMEEGKKKGPIREGPPKTKKEKEKGIKTKKI